MPDTITIAVVAPLQPEDFFDLLWQGAWEATFDLSSFSVEVQNLTTQSDDVSEQRNILQGLLESRPDAIALLPAHASALNDLIDEHVKNGTPVVTFYGDAPDSARTVSVQTNLQVAGAMAGEALAKLMHGRGRILSFPGLLHGSHLTRRYQGFQDALARYAGLIEESASACSVMTPEALRAGGPADGYYVGRDLVRIATLLEELDIPVPCLGFSNTERVRPFLERGVISAVIDENRYQLGYFAVQKAYEAVLKRDTGVTIAGVQIPSTVVFAANAGGAGDSLGSAFELLVRQRTEILVSYKNRLEQANVQLLDLAITDPLTGLYNRRKFEEVLNQEVQRALRYGPVSLLAIDLNEFKSVNDTYGHQTGDEALKAVAQGLQSACRTTDTCARLGGDEFAIILPHSDSAAAAVARRVIPTAQGGLTIGLSIGVATLPGDAANATELVAAADAAMYDDKQASRCVVRN